MPGVSTYTAWQVPAVLMPIMLCLVVCGLREVIASFCPRIWFIRVDLPTLGRPTTATKPARCSVCSVICITIINAKGGQGCCGSHLFGNAAAGSAAFGSAAEQANLALHMKSTAMWLALNINHFVVWQLDTTRLQKLLQPGFGILVGIHQRQAGKLRLQPGQHTLAGALKAGVQINCADYGLGGIRQNGITAK